MTVEIELKLLLPPDQIPRLGRLASVAAATRGRPGSRQLHSVYYDTPQRDLARHGVALRLRRSGARWVQTLKTEGRVRGALHERSEFEAPAAAQIINFVALSQTPAAALFADAALRARLQPVFATDFRRTTRQLQLGGGTRALLCVDLGRIVATQSGREAPLCELELELESGEPGGLFAFARSLLPALSLRVCRHSKAERGFALLDPPAAAVAPARAQAPRLHPDMDVTAAFEAIAASCLMQLQDNEPGVLASDDPEFIHQARVALRRLRSAFALFRPVMPRPPVADLLQALRTNAASLGEARDWDVFCTETAPPVCAALGDAPGLPRLLQLAAARRAQARAAALETMAGPAYTCLLLDLGSALAARPWRAALDEAGRAREALPLPEFAALLLARQARRVRRAGRGLGALDETALHALRIEVKKLRYAAEFLQRLFRRGAVRDYIAATAELQEILGSLNDAAVTARLLAELNGGDATQLSHAAGLVRGWSAARAAAGIGHLSHAWSRFEAARPFWRSSRPAEKP